MDIDGDLIGRAGAGDAEAQFTLGMEIMSGPRAGVEWRRGIALIETASARGHAQASERCAIFECMGIGRVSNWNRALDFLLLAADQGSSTAQGQLMLLCDGSKEPVVPKRPRPGFWRELRSRTSIDQRVQCSESRSLSDRPWIRGIEGFATSAECRWLIALARDRLKPATVVDPATGILQQHPTRTNRGVEFQVLEMDLVMELIRARISAAVRLPLPLFETSQVLHYSVGQEFRPHHDFLDPKNEAHRVHFAEQGQRIATFLIYLNEEFGDGETSFPAIGLNHRGRTGDALFFANVDRDGRPDALTLHAGLPPTWGEKWIFSQWIRDRAPARPSG